MSSSPPTQPDYVALVRFLVTPFLEYPESLTVDFESYASQHRVLVRLAFASSDKGRVFGRGGRTLHAIRALVEAAAALAGQTIYLEVFGERDPLAETSGPPRPIKAKGIVERPKPRLKKPEDQVVEGE
ncbi:MAG: KH domain-containing protein [Thermosynechococcaceae cyanobacterium MS004]|nr:KH domain-containing protein [Thermosynechococcaceae cyanobacterium MS004]